jgi:hypothetical protein
MGWLKIKLLARGFNTGVSLKDIKPDKPLAILLILYEMNETMGKIELEKMKMAEDIHKAGDNALRYLCPPISPDKIRAKEIESLSRDYDELMGAMDARHI